jgi:hypothetical protein
MDLGWAGEWSNFPTSFVFFSAIPTNLDIFVFPANFNLFICTFIFQTDLDFQTGLNIQTNLNFFPVNFNFFPAYFNFSPRASQGGPARRDPSRTDQTPLDIPYWHSTSKLHLVLLVVCSP